MSANNKKKETQIFDQVDQLQAIVILETYLNKFQPLSEDIAECLLPLLGKPLIDYTVEYLIEQNVEDIQLYFTRHSKTIISYINTKLKSTWREYASIIKYNVIKSDSFGETMRCIYSKNSEIRKTFVLVTTPGLIVNNVNLRERFDAHIQHLTEDKNLLMTILATSKNSNLTVNQNLKSIDDTLIVHDANSCVLYFDRLSNASNRKRTVSLPKNVMEYLTKIDCKKSSGNAAQQQQAAKSSATLQLRTDLFPTNVFICQHAIIQEFDDNFDALTLCDLIKQLLQNELSGHTIYFDLIQTTRSSTSGTYASSICNLNEYFTECMRLIQRHHLFNRLRTAAYFDTTCQKARSCNNLINVYYDSKSVRFGKNCALKRNLYFDLNCTIGDNCELVNCFLGKNCVVEDNVQLSNCIVLDNTRIGKNSVLNACILGEKVQIGANSRLCENTLFSSNCILSANTVIDKADVFYVEQEDDFDAEDVDDDEKKVLNLNKADNYTRFNPNSTNFQSSDSESDDMDDDYEQKSTAKSLEQTENRFYFYIWPFKSSVITNSPRDQTTSNDDTITDDAQSSTFEVESSYDELSDSDECTDNEDESKLIGVATGSHREEDDKDEDLDDDEKAFLTEIDETLKRYLLIAEHNADNIQLEINGCKHASYVQIDDLFCYLIRALLKFPEKNAKFLAKITESSQTYLDKSKFLFKWYSDLIVHYLDVTKKKSPLLFMNSIVNFFCVRTDKQFIDLNCVKLLHYLNQDLDILSEESILAWNTAFWQQTSKNNDKTSLKYYIAVKLEPFVKWLKEADEEDDDDDDDENDD